MDLALFTYKTKPLNHRLSSPAELLNSRKYNTLLPTYIGTNKTARKLQTDHGPRKASTGTTVQQDTRVLPRLQQSQKVVVQLDPDKNIWTPAEIIQCPANKGRSYSLKTIHGGVYTRNRRFIKPDLTEAVLLDPRPDNEPRMARPTRTIRKLDRLIKSK